ncbi:MAG: hypothetical protein JW384_03385 [Nitrosomonadaceae bacterium]|nr:hypothetical protein [Nitrosomonadaceae bacterium]
MKNKKPQPLLTPAELKELHLALYKASDDDSERAAIAVKVLALHYQTERENHP